MDYVDLSDLEEGEILEYESDSPNDSRCDDFEIKNCSIRKLRKKYNNCDFQIKGNQESDMYIYEQGRDGYIDKSLKNNWKFSEKLEDVKTSLSMVDLESISSEEEHKSDEENKYSIGNKKCTIHRKSEKEGRKKQSTQFYGTVEDIMSEIGETICRKSRCNYKKRKSKDSQHSLNRYSEKSYDLWSHKIFSSHLKNKKHKRNVSFSDSDSDSNKDRTEKRKKKKRRREVEYEEDKRSKKNTQVRDFDEVRRTLLEKLKKQKAEEELKASTNECVPEMENSEIQEVDMLIDCTNYVDNPRDAAPEDSAGELGTQEKEDELDLIKLRLIALASNKKQRCGEIPSDSVKSNEVLETKKSLDKSHEEVDLDRNELLLRAEALKTALLKKHQKRLNRLKVKKAESIEGKDVTATFRSINCLRSEEVSANLDPYACKENVEEEREGKEATHDMNLEDKINEINETSSETTEGLKKANPRPRTKRKKRKSGSFANNLKENTDTSEAFEEDDRALRSQLLSDLMKKKSLKNMEEKSVLSESIQTSANKPPSSVIPYQPPKENGKPPPMGRKTLLKKVNPPKVVKPLMGIAIPKAEIERIIVHLGSEDSSEEDDGLCKAPSAVVMEENQEEKKDSKKAVNRKLTHVNKATHADCERSVELLLSQARKKIEGEKQVSGESKLSTPEAVYKHLPPSQRLEYIRLKQKIAERESLRNKATDNSGVFPPVDSKTSAKEFPNGISPNLKPENILKAATKPIASSSKNNLLYKSLPKPVVALHSPSSERTMGGITKFNRLRTKEVSHRRVVNKSKNNLEGASGKVLPPGKESKSGFSIQRSRLLLPSSQALITKLKLLLKKIKIEKIIEENYEKEILKLKNQLSLLEKKKNEQRFKIKKLGEESMKTYKVIQSITSKSNEKPLPKKNDEALKEKEGGDSESKEEEKKPEEKEIEGKNVSNEPGMEFSKAQSEIDKRLNNGDKNGEIAEAVDVCFVEYQSPLQVFNKVSYCSERVDPNVMMCQFDLTGVCKDEECTYQHLRTS